jgi:hypothetical protein
MLAIFQNNNKNVDIIQSERIRIKLLKAESNSLILQREKKGGFTYLGMQAELQ